MALLSVASKALVQWHVEAHDTIDSTNTAVKTAISQGILDEQGLMTSSTAAELTRKRYAVTSLVQTGGYGRQGRSWSSPVGGLYMSCALPAHLRAEQTASLSLVVGLAVRAALLNEFSDVVSSQAGRASSGLDANLLRIKWPNDVLYNGEKICGISLELVNAHLVCIGIGINIFKPYEASTLQTAQTGSNRLGKYRIAHIAEIVQLPNACISSAGLEGLQDDQACIMERVLVAVLKELTWRFDLWQRKSFAEFCDEFNSVLAYKGEHVTMETIAGAKRESGIVHSVTPTGTLLVQGKTNLQEVSSGEVHFL